MRADASYGTVVFGQQSECPKSEDISPCTCKTISIGLHVVCAKFNSSASLTKALGSLKHRRVFLILFHALYITDTLPDDLFDDIQVREVHVEESRLHFAEPAFSGLESSLNILNVAQNTRIKSEERFSLAKLPKLTKLQILYNGLYRVRDDWLNEKIPNVHTIVLDWNEISVIEDNAFSNLASLKLISLSENRIKNVKRSMFPQPALQLSRIDLSYNQLESLPGNIFREMPSLKEVILSGNEIKTLEEGTWSEVWEKLNKVFLTDNRLECEENLKWIKNYRQPYELEGKCVEPKNMLGKPIKEVYKM
ncbi:hypothetical protein TNIN_324671 [Trichonephila inaurata madagascariensis]|uniref:Uncharacterized protein n=1 Tax=Trichonephila inaurata madagascariensis TaxID=2747483 RepID=A0A8X6XRA5_9ARAC|nr:hypothetical protein TNIN_324671 [Trichonephila inaurata madagascariensis]